MRVVIIGAGHNGLVAAYYLAKAGLKPLVLERRNIAGGACVTEEFHPGFRCSTLATGVAPLLPQIAGDLELQRHGLEFIKPAVQVCAPNPDGRPVCIYDDANRTASEIAHISTKDAERYPEFVAAFDRIGQALRPLLTMTPPNVEAPSKGELWHLGKLGWAIRGLGRKDEYRLLRYGPMAVADLAAEWFEDETLRAIVAARGIFGAFAGPWSAGTSVPLLLQSAINGAAISPSVFVRGGMGALTNALARAATAAGTEIRTDENVIGIEIANSQAVGVILERTGVTPAWAVVSAGDPGTTLLELLDPGELDPNFRLKMLNYRAHGSVAKLNLALAALPEFVMARNGDLNEKLCGRIHIGPEIDYLERAFDAAKYGDISPKPYLEVTIPTLTDQSLAPKGAHVMSVHAQFAPYKLKSGDWTSRREELAGAIINTLSEYAPNLKSLIVASQLITPLDFEQTYGFRGGHIHHGEMSLDQLFAFRPLIGWASYRTPIANLYLCGSGTHPGGGITGAPGLNASREIIKDLKRR